MRDEAPLYFNEKHEFFALSRFDDVKRAHQDWATFSSGRSSVLEMIKQGITEWPGLILFEDPPLHNHHRSLLSRIFHPRVIEALEPKIRAFCENALDPLVGGGGFDFIADIGAEMPMLTIGMLLGIPEQDQRGIRDAFDEGFKKTIDPGASHPEVLAPSFETFAAYVDYRVENPSDDLMTRLLTETFVDDDGVEKSLTRQEVLNFVGLLAGAGNETTTRLIGWAGKVLAENPDQRAELAANPSLIPQAIEELLRYESPSPVQGRYVTREVELHGETVPEGSVMVLLNASANHDERRFPDPDRFDIHRHGEHHVAFGYGIHFCLGAALARLEGRVALEEILKRFPTWEVDWDNAVQAHTSTVRGWEKLPVLV